MSLYEKLNRVWEAELGELGQTDGDPRSTVVIFHLVYRVNALIQRHTARADIVR